MTTTDKPLRRGDRCPCLLDRLEVSRRGHDAAYDHQGRTSLLGTGLLARRDCGRCQGGGHVTNPGADPSPPVGMRPPVLTAGSCCPCVRTIKTLAGQPVGTTEPLDRCSVCIGHGTIVGGYTMAGLAKHAGLATGRDLEAFAGMYEVERCPDGPWAIETDDSLRARLLVAMGLEPAPPSPKINMADRDIARHEGVPPALVAERRARREAEARRAASVAVLGSDLASVFDDPAFDDGAGVDVVGLSPPPERLTTLAEVHALADELWRGCHSAGTVIVDAATHEGERWTLVRCVLGPWSSDVLIEPEPPEHQVHMAVTGCWRDVSDRVAKGWRP